MKTLIIQFFTIFLLSQINQVVFAATPTVPTNNDRICLIEGLSLNSNGEDFSPAFYQNGLVFCSSRQAPIWSGLRTGSNNMNLYFAPQKANNNFAVPQKLKGKINSRTDEGPLAFVPNSPNNTVWFTRTKPAKNRKGMPHLGLFFTTLNDNRSASVIQEFEHNMKGYNLAHPVFSADGEELYFSADFAGGEGGTDIYVCYRIGKSWSRPQNLGPEINSWGNEKFPFIHEDGTLYFSSDGHVGMGGLDIFYAKQIGRNVWTAAQNYGEPVNSDRDDFGLILKTDKRNGYFSSNRKGGLGKDDIYSLQIEGQLLEDMNEYESINSKPLMMPASQALMIKENMFLNEILELGNIHFESRNFKITPMVARALDEVIAFMKSHPGVNIELGSHTDAVSNDQANKRLSVKRANAARAYLVNAGVSIQSMKTKGYGESQLLNHCKNGINCPKEKHLENDRLTIRVTKAKNVVLAKNRTPNTFSLAQKNRNINPNKKADETQGLTKVFDHNLAYVLEVGPLDKLDNRTYQECLTLNEAIDIKYTPQGKIIRLGPYENVNQAKQHQEKIAQLGVADTKITDGFGEIDLKEEVKHSSRKYSVFIGPFKHVDTDTYYKFVRLATKINIEYESNGMMIILGPYTEQADAEHYKMEANKKIVNLKEKKRKSKKTQISAEIRTTATAGSGRKKKSGRPRF